MMSNTPFVVSLQAPGTLIPRAAGAQGVAAVPAAAAVTAGALMFAKVASHQGGGVVT